jgi:hypothetical protein
MRDQILVMGLSDADRAAYIDKMIYEKGDLIVGYGSGSKSSLI